MCAKQGYLQWCAILVAAIFFSAGLSVNKVVNFSFYLLILFSLASILLAPGTIRDSICASGKKHWFLFFSMGGTALAIFANQLSRGVFKFSSYDYASRSAMFCLLFLLFIQIPTKKISFLKWGFAIGAILPTIRIFQQVSASSVRTNFVDALPIIPYAELVLLLGIFSVLAIDWQQPRRKLTSLALLLAGLCGLYAAYLSQSRGAWAAIPLLGFIAARVFIRKPLSLKKWLASVLVGMILFGGLASNSIVQERMTEVAQDIDQFTVQSNIDTSLGTRFQLWHASWLSFRQAPIFGVGPDNYGHQRKQAAQLGIITSGAAQLPHAHNEMLNSLMTLGIIGAIGLLLTYLTPAVYFYKELRHPDLQIRIAASMGLALCLGYFIFGLADVLFYWKICNVFYSMACAVFLAFILKRKDESGTLQLRPD